MYKITYKGIEYPIYTINIADVYETQSCDTWVSEESLNEAICDDVDKGVEEAVHIDNCIFFYLPNGFLKEGITYEEVIAELIEELS